MELRSLILLAVAGLLLSIDCSSSLEDLLAVETRSDVSKETSSENAAETPRKYSSKIREADETFGRKTSNKKSKLDFRIEPEALKTQAAGAGKSKEDDEEEKTLAQQVADGKYGLIQNELFPNGSQRPGIISYSPNPEVPKDTKKDYGGLDKDEIWLAEDHVLVLRGGGYAQRANETPWTPIDDYQAPPRQVEIPKNPKIPPPFPVQLTDNGPLEFIRGENGSLPPRPPFFPPFPPPGINNTGPYPAPPGPAPPFLPPGAAFLPPPGNFTDFDEDDPSIYYPPRYDFYYPQDNTTAVPPGPLVPGIILPPPPDFFSPEKPREEDNETEPEDETTKPPFVGPAYLPSDNRKPFRPRTYTKRPPLPRKPTTVTYVYPETETTTVSPKFHSPIYVPNKENAHTTRVPPYSRPTTTYRPHHISIPRDHTLKQDIYIVTTQPPEPVNDIINLIKESPSKTTSLEGISPNRHPLRSLIRPNVSVSYVGKVGHLPPSTAFPFPKTESTTESINPSTGHYITFPPSVTVTPVPIVKKVRYKPTDTATQNPHATFFFYEEPPVTPPTSVEENEVSASPIDQFLKENFKPTGPDFELSNIVKTPTYINRNKLRSRPKPVYLSPQVPNKLRIFEIENQGLSGLNTPQPPTDPPVLIRQPPPKKVLTSSPLLRTTEAPFVPSNYYATANPENMHFTPLDPTMIDDITMKYFTIFGQKLNAAGGTTPLTPIPPTQPPATSRPGKPTYVYPTSTEQPYTNPAYNTRPQVIHTYPTTTTTEPSYTIQTTRQPPATRPPHSYVQISTPKPRPQFQFEQLLQDITGHDQQDYIITHNEPIHIPKYKKPKSRPGFTVNTQPQRYYLPYQPGELPQYLQGIYRTTTERPAAVQPQVQYSTTTHRPYGQPKPLSHNMGQFLQEVTYTGPNFLPKHQYFDQSDHTPVRQQYKPPPPPQPVKPVSLEGDILVNYKQPVPPIEPDAEYIRPQYDLNSNIKIVDAPDLSQNRPLYRPIYKSPSRSPRPPPYEPAQAFLQNLPQSGYFEQSQATPANSFVSYNLPGNGGHFYFLTPQALGRSDVDGREDENKYRVYKRSDESASTLRRGEDDEEQQSASQHYLRRRRKKS